MAEKKFARKKLFVNSLIQGRLIWRAAAYWTIYHIVLWHTLFLFQYFQYRVELVNGGLPMTFGELYGTFCLKYYPIIISAVAILPVLLIDVVRISHHIAGPLVNFQNVFKRMQKGEHVESVTLREGDMLTEFQEAFNAFLVHYNQQQGHANSLSESIGETEICTEEELLASVQELQQTVAEETEAIGTSEA